MPGSKIEKHFFYLAPIRGITDALFRTLFHTYFPFFDSSVAPFINPQRHANFKDKFLADIFPENNKHLPTIPQLLYNNKEDFVYLGKRLEDLGYTHINWNLGCPAPQVANKKRGSGLLPYPKKIVEILNHALPKLKCTISIKMRLGFQNALEIETLLPLLDQYELEEIIIHPRIGKQLYKGTVDLDSFAKCRNLTRHTVVYNGDITTNKYFKNLSNRFPELNRWMIGRGALANPFLVAEIKGQVFSNAEKKEKILSFHDDLYSSLQEKLSGPGHLLSRMKQIWAYLIDSFPENEKVLKKIRKASTEKKYKQAIESLTCF